MVVAWQWVCVVRGWWWWWWWSRACRKVGVGGKRGWLWVHVSRHAGMCGERVVMVMVIMCGHC